MCPDDFSELQLGVPFEGSMTRGREREWRCEGHTYSVCYVTGLSNPILTFLPTPFTTVEPPV